MKIKHLTQAQKKKVDKIDTLLTQLRKEGVYPFMCGGRGSNLFFIRTDDTDEAAEMILSQSQYYYEEYDDLFYKTYEAPNSSENVIEAIGL